MFKYKNLIKIQNDKSTKDVEIVNVWFSDIKQKNYIKFETGEDIVINIDYNAKKEIKNPVFGISIFTEEGVLLTGPNSKFHNFNIEKIKGLGSIKYKIKSIPFLKGTYYVTIVIHPHYSFKPYDIHEKGYWFIVTTSEIDDFGIIRLNSEWENN